MSSDQRTLLLHDNAGPHKARARTQSLQELRIQVLPHPAYSPDLAPCDVWLFPILKDRLAGRKFDRIQDLAKAVNSELRTIPEEDYQCVFRKWLIRLKRCIESHGELKLNGGILFTESIPGPPRNLTVRLNLKELKTDALEANFHLEWRPPKDWPQDSLQFDLMSEMVCPPLVDKVYIYRDKSIIKIDLEQETVYVVFGRIPLYAIGCTITFLVGSKPKCVPETRVKSVSVATTTLTFECSALPGYKGKYCNAPPLGIGNSVQGQGVYPSPVRNVTLMVMPVPGNKLLARVFWLPPERLGSAGYVDAYYLFWGVVELYASELFPTFKSDLASTKVPGDQLTGELLLNISSFEPYETLGVVIQAAGPNQTVVHAFSNIHKSVNTISASYDFSPEDIIANDSTVYVIQTKNRDQDSTKVNVDVFWRRPELYLGLDVSGYQVTLQPQQITSDPEGLELLAENMTSTRHFNTTTLFQATNKARFQTDLTNNVEKELRWK
ncbi:transposase [Elysia marginata]|uniref:Transposase n=1 Tax=Elysia marginata TaxID=1093978 RepID=A0AAV4HCL6_9GAST|nr:transposase [Elysia marginata]